MITKKLATDLNKEIDKYMDWFTKKMVKGKYTDIGERRVPIEIRNFIETMAVWYEFRYPTSEIYYNCPSINVFMENPSLTETQKEALKDIKWNDLFNSKTFLDLVGADAWVLSNPEYKTINILDGGSYGYLYTDDMGKISDFYISRYLESKKMKYLEENIKGLSLDELILLLKKMNFDQKNIQNVIEVKEDYNNRKNAKEGFLDCVMYRIIERGGNRIGARRGFLFAKEFNRNIDIPMMYGVDTSDPGLRTFINEYLKAGGNKDLNCYVNLGFTKCKNQFVDIMTINQLLKVISHDCCDFYTPEEDLLHQKLADALCNLKNKKQDEDCKQLRIERKLK